MAEVKIEASSFISFLRKVHLDGLVYDCIVKAKDGFIGAKGLDVARAIFFRVVEEAKVEEEGELIIGNIDVFCKVLARFDGMVKVIANKKEFVIRQRGKVGRFEVTPRKSIDSFSKAKLIEVKKDRVKTPHAKVKYKTNDFTVDADQLGKIVGDADILDEHTYTIIIDGKSIKIKVQRGRNSFTTKLDNKKSHLRKNMEITYAHGIKEIFKTVDGRVKFYIEKNPPLLIRFGDGLKSLYLVMPKEEG
jgi:hypothetical protein